MSQSINFVSATRKRLTAAQKKDREYFRWSVGILAGAFGIFLLVLGARFFFIFQAKQIENRQQEVRAAILAREELEEEYTIFVHKLKLLSDLFGKRKDKQEALIFFNEVFGPRVQVSGIDYSGSDEDMLRFTLNAPDIFLLDSVFEILKSTAVTAKYSSVQKEGLRRLEDGSYAMQLTLVFGEAPAATPPAAAPTNDLDLGME